jgi:hypothetical protein
MEDFIEGLMTKCGLSKEKAEEVVDYIKDNYDKVPELVGKSGVAKHLPGGLDKLL